MVNFIVYIFAFLITIPMIATALVYFISLKLQRIKKKAFHTAVNWTTIFYVIAVIILFQINFSIKSTGYILIFILGVLTIIILYQWKVGVEIELKKAFRVLWRFCFLLFLLIYILLVCIGIIMRIF
ncbi:DUF3397 domain-containing protein [Oceanobacillus halophilus]|uniref:DUF3397 domain-containing protein n=1 Tax=Oceanobacillus halophilus TaxID=930130 RepID=A0A495ABJ4_9BACI|nr:DUF3397 domain-containing protein [Oceanobacillus halophilus]